MPSGRAFMGPQCGSAVENGHIMAGAIERTTAAGSPTWVVLGEARSFGPLNPQLVLWSDQP
jgi:hypothetical protein